MCAPRLICLTEPSPPKLDNSRLTTEVNSRCRGGSFLTGGPTGFSNLQTMNWLPHDFENAILYPGRLLRLQGKTIKVQIDHPVHGVRARALVDTFAFPCPILVRLRATIGSKLFTSADFFLFTLLCIPFIRAE